MKTAQVIASSVESLPKGVFTYANFIRDPKQKEAIIKALNRMTETGKITKLAKGKYYKSEDCVNRSCRTIVIYVDNQPLRDK